MTILAHGSGFDDLLLVLVPVAFILVYRLFRGSPPKDGGGSDDEQAPR